MTFSHSTYWLLQRILLRIVELEKNARPGQAETFQV